MSFYARYPSDAGASSNLSVGTNGAMAPTSSTEVGGINPSGNLQPLQTDASGRLIVSIGSGLTNPLPVTDAAAEASLASIDTKTPTVGQKAMAASSPVVIASDQSAVPISAASLPLPTGAATSANQTNASQKTQIVDGSGNVIAATSNALNVSIQGTSPVSGTVTANQGTANTATNGWPVKPTDGTNSQSYTAAGEAKVQVTQPLPAGTNIIGALSANQSVNLNQVGASAVTLGSKTSANSIPVVIASDQAAVPASQSGTWNINNVSGTVSLPTGASTSALQTTISGQLPATLGQKAMAASMAVTIASDQSAITTTSTQAGYTRANAPVTIASYSSTPVTTAAYTQLVASTSNATKQVQIFDSSGQAMILATGAAAAEVDFVYIPPGGGIFNLAIAASTRVSLKALTATASSGYFIISFLG